MPSRATDGSASSTTGVRLLLGLASVSAVACLGVALTPFDMVRSRLDLLAGDGSADLYTPEIHARFQAAGGVLGALALSVAVLLWRYRSRAANLLTAARERLRKDARRLIHHTVGLIGNLWGWLFITTVVAAAVRLHYVDEPMRYDEAHTFVKYASMPAALIVTRYDEPNNHILHTLCVRATTGIFGTDPWAIRLTALTCGVLLAPLTLCWGTLTAGRTTGITAGMLVAALSNLVEFSVNARGYTLASLLFGIACLSGGYALRRNNTAAWTVMVAAIAASLWTVPTMLYGVIALFVWLRIGMFAKRHRPRHRRRWISLLIAFAATIALSVVCYLPVLLAAGLRKLAEIGSGPPTSWGGFLAELPADLVRNYGWMTRDVPVWVQGTLWIGALIAMSAGSSARRRRLWRAVTAAVCVIVVLALGRVHPPERTWTFAIPPILILAAAGIGLIARWLQFRWVSRRVSESMGLVLLLPTIVSLLGRDSIRTSEQTGAFREAAEIVAQLDSIVGEGEPIIAVTPASAPLVYYSRQRGMSEQHFMVPGRGLTDDASAIVVTSRELDQTPRSVLGELDLLMLFDPETATLAAEFPTARVDRVSRR